MKQIISGKKVSTVLRALSSCCLLSLFIYVIVRTLFFEFPMSAMEEIIFFLKLTGTSCLIIVSATAGAALVHNFYASLTRNKHKATF